MKLEGFSVMSLQACRDDNEMIQMLLKLGVGDVEVRDMQTRH